jgi:hypothetical protein
MTMTIEEQRAFLLDHYWGAHPRYWWFATQPENGRILHIRNGDDFLPRWRSAAERDDLTLDACDTIETSEEQKTGYDKVIPLKIETQTMDGPFNRECYTGILMLQVLQPLKDIAILMDGLFKLLANRGTIFFEWTDTKLNKPKWGLEEIRNAVTHEDLQVQGEGTIVNPVGANAMMVFGKATGQNDVYMYGFTAKNHLTRWLIAEKNNDR